MRKIYYIWGPKYIGGELNGPDLIAGVALTEGNRLEFTGRNPRIMLNGMSVEEAEGLNGGDALRLFHAIVDQPVPASLQLAYSNASKEESAEFIRSLPSA